MSVITEDDIYSGYDDYPSVYNAKDLDQDEFFQEALKTNYAKRSIVSTPGFLKKKKKSKFITIF